MKNQKIISDVTLWIWKVTTGWILPAMCNMPYQKQKPMQRMFCYKNKACGFTPLWYVSDRCEVIGNAFDNPELMKEGVQP